LEPALAIVGTWLTVIVTFELEGAHGALEIVHVKILFPNPNPVILVLGALGFVIVPLPETKVHSPEPTSAVLAFITVEGEEIHKV